MGSSSSVAAKTGNPVKYAYSNARVMALRSFMLKDEDMRALSSAKNLQDYVSLLDHTVYKQDMGKLTDASIGRIEEALMSNLVATSRLATEVAPANASQFFEALMGAYEIELIKLIINRFEDTTDGKAKERDYSAYNPVIGADIRNFAKESRDAKNRSEALEMLKPTEYGFIARLPVDEVRSSGQVSSLLDKHYFERLWNVIPTLKGNDAAYARKLVGTEIDAINILTLLRYSSHGSKAEKYLISGGLRLAEKAPELAGKESGEIIAALSASAYKDLVAEGLKNYEKDKSLLKLELGLKKYVLDEYKKVFKGSPFHIGVLLGFLKLKEYELKNLRAIAVSVENGLGPKDIMDMVIA